MMSSPVVQTAFAPKRLTMPALRDDATSWATASGRMRTPACKGVYPRTVCR